MATTRRSSKQSGGTFLGIVLGLIVGLAIAVVVALYITHAPTPFVARTPPQSEAASAVPGAINPNQILQGQSPAQPVPPNTAPGQLGNSSSGLLDEPQIVEVPGPASSPTTSLAPPAVGTVPPASAPAAPAAPASTATANNSGSPANDANTGYYLQVGAYKTQADAEQQRAQLALQGFESKVTRRDSGGITYFRVRLGPYPKFDDMNHARQRLSDAGIDVAVIRFTKQ